MQNLPMTISSQKIRYGRHLGGNGWGGLSEVSKPHQRPFLGQGAAYRLAHPEALTALSCRGSSLRHRCHAVASPRRTCSSLNSAAINISPASRVGLTPSPTCHTGQGGSRKGMRPLRQRNGSRESVSPPRETGGGFFIWNGAPTRSGDLVPACQPVQIAELAKSETRHDRDDRSSFACR